MAEPARKDEGTGLRSTRAGARVVSRPGGGGSHPFGPRAELASPRTDEPATELTDEHAGEPLPESAEAASPEAADAATGSEAAEEELVRLATLERALAEEREA